MAERRMFAKTIIDSDAFLDMPLSTQALYFHLSMRADDEGFINNPRKIQRMIGCSEDDLKLLMAKRFIIPFPSGIVVIKHWRIHNYIQKDRFKKTVYQEERAALTVKGNGVYTECIQDGYSLETQDRLGKVSIDNIQVKNRSASAPLDDGFDAFWKAYPKKVGKQAALRAWKKLKPNTDLANRIVKAVESQKRWEQWTKDNGQYIPNPATWLNQGRWDDERMMTDDDRYFSDVR